MIKIALVGKKAAGKTFVAFYLKRRYKFKSIRISDGASKLMRFFYMYGKHKRPSWERRIDIYDALYKIDPDIHINYLLRKLETTTSHVVVDDVRYVNELVKLREAGFTIIRVNAPENRRRKIGATLRKAASGTLVLEEYFREDKTAPYSADYSLFNETRDGTREAMDKIIKELDTEGYFTV